MLTGVVVMIAACAAERGDAGWYRQALAGASTFDEAAADCGRIEDHNARGDCMMAIEERFDRLQASDCALIDEGVWRAEASLDEDAALAEGRLGPFSVSRPVPDAAIQFWMIRFREQVAAGRPIDEQDCAALQDPPSCERAVWASVKGLLDLRGRAGLNQACAAELGQRVTHKGAPSWRRGPLADGAEARWVADRCERGAR